MTPEAKRIVPSQPANITRREFLEHALAVGLTLSGAGVSACGEQPKPPSANSITPSTGTGGGETPTPTEQIGGTPLGEPMQMKNVEGTTMQYFKLETPVLQGNSLILSLQAGSQQDVGVFKTKGDETTWITNQETNNTPIYQQPSYFPSDTTQPAILVLEQDKQDAYDLILLRRDGDKPQYEARVAPNDQVNTIIQQMQTVHTELQGVQPVKEQDYQPTLPTDPHFA